MNYYQETLAFMRLRYKEWIERWKLNNPNKQMPKGLLGKFGKEVLQIAKGCFKHDDVAWKHLYSDFSKGKPKAKPNFTFAESKNDSCVKYYQPSLF